MKNILNLVLILTFSSFSFSQDLTGKERGERASLSFRLANYTKETAKTLPVTMTTDVESFAVLSLTEKNDSDLVRNVLRKLIILDAPESKGGDPSRELLDVVAPSFQKHKEIYLKAMKSIENRKNKKQLQEFKEILSRTTPAD